MSATYTTVYVGRRGTVDESIRHNCLLEGDTFWETQPVKEDERLFTTNADAVQKLTVKSQRKGNRCIG